MAEETNQVTLDGKALAKLALLGGLIIGGMGGWIAHTEWSKLTAPPEYENVIAVQ